MLLRSARSHRQNLIGEATPGQHLQMSRQDFVDGIILDQSHRRDLDHRARGFGRFGF